MMCAVAEAVRPKGPGEHGEGWKCCVAHRELLQKWLDEDLWPTKIHSLLTQDTGQPVPYRTLHRFAAEELGFVRRRATVRVTDGRIGEESQVDFGQMGRRVWALPYTAVYSCHLFGWSTLEQSLESVVEAFERAWTFFGGVYRVIIPDNFRALGCGFRKIWPIPYRRGSVLVQRELDLGVMSGTYRVDVVQW